MGKKKSKKKIKIDRTKMREILLESKRLKKLNKEKLKGNTIDLK